MERRDNYAGKPVDFACQAIENTINEGKGPRFVRICGAMRDVFAPGDRYDWAWLTEEEASPEEQLNIRILALCFMAAIVEAGDMPA